MILVQSHFQYLPITCNSPSSSRVKYHSSVVLFSRVSQNFTFLCTWARFFSCFYQNNFHTSINTLRRYVPKARFSSSATTRCDGPMSPALTMFASGDNHVPPAPPYFAHKGRARRRRYWRNTFFSEHRSQGRLVCTALTENYASVTAKSENRGAAGKARRNVTC